MIQYALTEEGEVESIHYAYDANRWLTSVKASLKGSEEKKLLREYTYDNHGKVSMIKEYPDFASEGNTCITKTYTYDLAGNRTKGNETTTYTYNGLDQLITAVTQTGETTTSNRSYTYDDSGNQRQETDSQTGNTVISEYDAENRLVRVTSGSLVQENLYNGTGQRIQKKEGTDVTNYFYQDGVVSYTTGADTGEKLIQNLLGLEGNVIAAETRETTESTEESTSLQYYLYNKDIQGSTSSILNETGEGELAYEYDEFGETEVKGTSSLDNEICYTGGIYDASTGLYYLNARYYDPENGRFMSQDSYRGELEDPDTLHLYAYCKNDPVNYVDPSGHWSFAFAGASYGYVYGAGALTIGLGTAVMVGGTVIIIAAVISSGIKYKNKKATKVRVLRKSKSKADYDPDARPNQKKQGRENKEKKKKNNKWEPRNNRRDKKPAKQKKHTPGREHRQY